MNSTKKSLIHQNRIFGLIAMVTAIVLVVPLIAMQLTNDVNWKIGDFIIMYVLLFGVGSLFVLIARKFAKKYWYFIGIVFILVVILVWVHLAVGIVNSWPLAGS